jgi:hypothetical protein
VPKDEEERKKYLLTDTDLVGELDRPADNEPLRKLVMILNVSMKVIGQGRRLIIKGTTRRSSKQHIGQRVCGRRWS